VELRRPYMHIHSVPDGEEVCVVSLRNSRVDHKPQVAKLLRQGSSTQTSSPARNGFTPGGNTRGQARDSDDRVFAVYGSDNTWLFKARTEREKVDWIFKIDQSYFDGNSRSGSGEVSGEEEEYTI
jgi:kinesin family protein 1